MTENKFYLMLMHSFILIKNDGACLLLPKMIPWGWSCPDLAA